MLNLNFFITLLVLSFNFFIGYKVWRSNPKQFTNKIFFFLVIELNLWMLFNNLAMSAGDNDSLALLFVRLTMVVTAAIPMSLYFLSLTFPDKKFPLSRLQTFFCLLWIFFNMAINFTPLVFTNAHLVNGNMLLTPALGVVTVALNMVIFMGAAIWNFFKKFRQAQGTEKIRLGYLVFSFVLAMLSAFVFNFLLVVAFQIGNLTNLGSWLMSSILTIIIGYSLLKIRFSGLDFVLARAFYYLILAIWVFIATFFLLNVKSWAGNFTYLLAAVFIIAWVIGFIDIYQNLQDFLIKKIVNHGLDWKLENKKFLHTIAQELSLNKIIDETLSFFSLLIRNTGNLIFEDFTDDGKFYLESTFAEKKDPRRLFELCEKEWQTQSNPRPIIFEELIFDRSTQHRLLISVMKKEGYGAVFPITLYSGAKGILAMGKKLNQDAYFIQDINLIEQTLQEVAMAVDRATVYQNTKNFNDHLQRKINSATKKLVRANEKLMAADKMKDEFVSVASHELRTPMTAIKNYLWLVNKNNDEKNFTQNKKFLQIALDSTERLINMVNDMLTISRIEGNRFELNKKPMDLNQAVDQVYLDLQPLSINKNFKFVKTTCAESLPIYADSDKVHEVIQNLVGNALKFTTEGKVEMHCEKKGRCAIFSVTDTGSGIDKQDFPKLFNKFCRLENSYVKIKETGTGLGLYICKQIMLKHSGDITFHSELGKGSTFTLIFPLDKPKK